MNPPIPNDSPSAPQPAPQATSALTKKRNFWFVQIDGIGVGFANGGAQFLAVFLARLGASNNQIGLLSSMPGLTGLILAMPTGRFLQNQTNIVHWYSVARLVVISCYALTGLLSFFMPDKMVITSILVLWAMATLPQTILAVCFSVVMNAVAGPEGRFKLMSWRWSILGLVTAGTAFLAGQLLTRGQFPLNYQALFITVSLGGLVSFYFSRKLVLPERPPVPPAPARKPGEQVRDFYRLITSHPAFVSFAIKRFVYLLGVSVGAPLFTLYYVREVKATDAWIGGINTAQTLVLVVGYFVWVLLSRRIGTRKVLLITTLGMSVYPALVASTQNLSTLVVIAGAAGIFSAGLDLVFFDELMRTVPVEYSAIFVSIAQTMGHLAAMSGPLLGTLIANHAGIGTALLVSALFRLISFALFALRK